MTDRQIQENVLRELDREPQVKSIVVPTRQGYGLATEADFDAAALLAAPDDGEASRLGHGGQQLVVLAEPEVVRLGSFGQRHVLEVDRARGQPERAAM